MRLVLHPREICRAIDKWMPGLMPQQAFQPVLQLAF